MPPLRLGIIGCGRIVRLAHLESLLRNPDSAVVVAIADPDPVSRAWAGERVPTAKLHDRFESLLTESDLDAVLVTVPSALHRPVAERAFQRGLHVYLEKPIATTLADGEAIVAAWRSAGTVARIGFNCRFNELYMSMRERVAAGDIGSPIAVRSALTAHWPGEATWRLAPENGGGGLLELASHHVDLLRFVFQTDVELTAASTWSNRRVDEAAMLQLRLTNGVHVQLLACYGTVEEDRFEVYGTDGKLVVDRYNSLVVEQVPSVAAGGIGTALRRAVAEVSAMPYGLRKRRAPGQEPSFAASLADFVAAIGEHRAGSPSLEDGLASLRVVEAARAAAHARTHGGDA